MVDQEPPRYRPRRAYVDPDAATKAPEPTPAPPAAPQAAEPAPAAPPRPAPADPPVVPSAPATPVDDDAPKPLYRDEVAGPATPPTTPSSDRADDTSTRQINFAPRRPRNADDDSTTILPRTSTGPRRPPGRDAIDDWDDEDEERSPIGRRTRTALLIGAVAAVIVIGLAVFYAVGGFTGTPTAGTSASSGSAPPSSAASSANPSTSGSVVELLSPAVMLTVDQAADLSGKTWRVQKTETTPNADLNPACLGGDPVEGQPASQQLITQVLGSSGKKAPSALHQATAYASTEDATQAFAIAAKTLGGCPVAGSYIASGRTVSGLGDQATGVVVNAVDGSKVQVHSIVASRTGRVVNILDVAQPDSAISMTKVARTLAAVVTTQCGPAGGTCDGTPKVKDGPPPLGGDEPGFLATGDLPPAKGQVSSWVGTATELPKDDFAGSGCEVVSWTTLDSESKTSRVYIYSDSGKAFFGVNEIVLTMKDDAAATKLATKIKDNIGGCKKRTLTATVTGPEKVSSVGARNTEVTGWTSVVTQKVADGTQKYRVGIVATGSKVVYTFLNPKGAYDFTDAQWDTVALRAGERATQVN
jgi:hypothetical protein